MQIVHQRNIYSALFGRGAHSIVKESQVTATKYIMTAALDAKDKDFEQMMQMLTGFWVTQIAGDVRNCFSRRVDGLLKTKR
jgi:hypothetical protein